MDERVWKEKGAEGVWSQKTGTSGGGGGEKRLRKCRQGGRKMLRQASLALKLRLRLVVPKLQPP